MIVTKHAKQRYKERIYERSSDFLVEQVAEEAYKNGKMPIQLYDSNPELFNYLQQIQDRFFDKNSNPTVVRLLQDAIFIFKKEEEKVKLITCYKVDLNNLKKE